MSWNQKGVGVAYGCCGFGHCCVGHLFQCSNAAGAHRSFFLGRRGSASPTLQFIVEILKNFNCQKMDRRISGLFFVDGSTSKT